MFSGNDCATLRFHEQDTSFFVKLKMSNRELDTLVDSGFTKSILHKEGIELKADVNQGIKCSEVKAIFLFPNGSIESALGQATLPCTVDGVQKYVDYKVVPNFKYQCVLGMDAI